MVRMDKNDPCHDCGACCMEQVSPPGYTGQEFVFFSTPEDERRFSAAPVEAQELVWAWQERIDSLPEGALLPTGEPCCWFNRQEKRCRFYEWRPSVCREFGVASDGCYRWREQYFIREILERVAEERA